MSLIRQLTVNMRCSIRTTTANIITPRIYTDQSNNVGHPLRTVWAGHGFTTIRDVENGTPARNEFLKKTFEFFQNGIKRRLYRHKDSKGLQPRDQNFPNPFNPSTRIQFALPGKGHVSLKIYNVAGQLVRTLQDGVMDAGSS